MSEELMDLILKYGDTFGSSFPMFQMGGLEEDELKKILGECIEKKKTVYQLGYLLVPSKNPDFYY